MVDINIETLPDSPNSSNNQVSFQYIREKINLNFNNIKGVVNTTWSAPVPPQTHTQIIIATSDMPISPDGSGTKKELQYMRGIINANFNDIKTKLNNTLSLGVDTKDLPASPDADGFEYTYKYMRDVINANFNEIKVKLQSVNAPPKWQWVDKEQIFTENGTWVMPVEDDGTPQISSVEVIIVNGGNGGGGGGGAGGTASIPPIWTIPRTYEYFSSGGGGGAIAGSNGGDGVRDLDNSNYSGGIGGINAENGIDGSHSLGTYMYNYGFYTGGNGSIGANGKYLSKNTTVNGNINIIIGSGGGGGNGGGGGVPVHPWTQGPGLGGKAGNGGGQSYFGNETPGTNTVNTNYYTYNSVNYGVGGAKGVGGNGQTQMGSCYEAWTCWRGDNGTTGGSGGNGVVIVKWQEKEIIE